MYLPMLRELIEKLNLPYIWLLDSALEWLPNYVTRGCEVASGIALPVLCYAFLPAYRKFCNEPDPDDLKLSKPKMQSKIQVTMYSWCLKITEKVSLRAKRATFTFRVDKSSLKMPKIINF